MNIEKEIWHTTKVKAGDGKIYDLGKGEHLPFHNHARGAICDACMVVNAWTERC